MLLRLGTLARTIMYDRRGTGLSDPLARAPTLEEEALDLEAVMEAAGCEPGGELADGRALVTAPPHPRPAPA